MENRQSPRKLLDPIHVTDIEMIAQPVILAHCGRVLNASASGLLIRIHRRDLNPDLLEHKRSLDAMEGTEVMMKIVEMELAIDARIARVHCVDATSWDIAVDFSDMAPDYWRECLADLLPNVDEIEQIDTLTNPPSC